MHGVDAVVSLAQISTHAHVRSQRTAIRPPHHFHHKKIEADKAHVPENRWIGAGLPLAFSLPNRCKMGTKQEQGQIAPGSWSNCQN